MAVEIQHKDPMAAMMRMVQNIRAQYQDIQNQVKTVGEQHNDLYESLYQLEQQRFCEYAQVLEQPDPKPPDPTRNKPRDCWRIAEAGTNSKEVPAAARKAQKEAIPKSQDTPTQGKSSNFVNSKEMTCYRCHKRGHYAATCPTRKMLKMPSLELKSKTSKSDSFDDPLNSNSSIMHLSLSKGFDTGLEKRIQEPVISKETKNLKLGLVPVAAITFKTEPDQSTRRKESIKEKALDQANNTESVTQVSLSFTQFISHDATAVLKSLLNIQEHEKTICLKSQVEEDFAKTSVRGLDSTSLSYPKESIMHLFLGQSVNLISGTKGAKHKEVPQEENLLLDQVQKQRRNAPMVINTKSTKGEDVRPDQSRGTVLSYLLKGEPPDVTNITKPHTYQGKTLNSQRRMKANLLSLGAGYTVSRSKPFQEGEYDEDIKSSSTKENGEGTKNMTKTLGEDQPERTKDIGVFLGAYRPNQEDLSYKSTCSRNLTHQGTTDKKNWFKIFPQEEDIQLTSRRTSNKPERDQPVLIEAFQSNHEEPSCKQTCFGNSTHQRHTENWIHVKIIYGLKVIQLLNQEILGLPYLEAHGFNHLQTRLWRPGEASNHSGESLNQSEESYITFPYTSSHRIRRILLPSNLPYSDVFTLGAFNHQQLFSYNFVHESEAPPCLQIVLRTCNYLPKLSRYKEPLFTLFGRFTLYDTNG